MLRDLHRIRNLQQLTRAELRQELLRLIICREARRKSLQSLRRWQLTLCTAPSTTSALSSPP